MSARAERQVHAATNATGAAAVQAMSRPPIAAGAISPVNPMASSHAVHATHSAPTMT